MLQRPEGREPSTESRERGWVGSGTRSGGLLLWNSEEEAWADPSPQRPRSAAGSIASPGAEPA